MCAGWSSTACSRLDFHFSKVWFGSENIRSKLIFSNPASDASFTHFFASDDEWMRVRNFKSSSWKDCIPMLMRLIPAEWKAVSFFFIDGARICLECDFSAGINAEMCRECIQYLFDFRWMKKRRCPAAEKNCFAGFIETLVFSKYFNFSF